ncbi:MAG: hypothetical protein K8E66_06885, partial [Phycisphaerales bacterium]|nr:hypothetical protein [Phycisphaerales bacterium]
MFDYTKQNPVPWADEFSQPTLAELIVGLEEDERPAFEAAIRAIKARKGRRDRIEWQGLPWRWTMCFTLPGQDHPALAYLIAKPGGAFVCIPVSIGDDHGLDFDELTKPVRTRLDQSPIIAGYIWSEWPVADLDPVAIKPLLDARG